MKYLSNNLRAALLGGVALTQCVPGPGFATPLGGIAPTLSSEANVLQPVAAAQPVTSTRPVRTTHQASAAPKTDKDRAVFTSGPFSPDDQMGEIEMFVGETRVIKRRNVARIAVGNGKIMSSAALDDKEILIIANEPGVSVLHVWTKDGRSGRIKVRILGSDMKRIENELVRFFAGFPNVKTQTIGEKIVVEGDNLSDADLFKIDELSKRYPQIINFTGRVGWEKMIYLDVKVVEFKKDKLRDLGVKWDQEIQGPAFGLAGDVRTNSYFRVKGQLEGEDQLPLRVTPFQSYLGIVTNLNSRIRLSEAKGDAVVLAEPKLAARSGSAAKFQAGGEIPYSAVSSLGQTTVIFKKYGVLLEIKPKADNSGAIRSEITAEVSQPDTSAMSSTGVPGLLTRRAETEFNVRAGETMVIAGLIDRRKSGAADQIPGLGSIPLLGYLFKSRNSQDRETELVVFVTPTIVDANSSQLKELKDRVEKNVDEFVNPPADPPTPMVIEPFEFTP